MDGGAGYGRDGIITNIKSYEEQETVERHDQQDRKGARQSEELYSNQI